MLPPDVRVGWVVDVRLVPVRFDRPVWVEVEAVGEPVVEALVLRAVGVRVEVPVSGRVEAMPAVVPPGVAAS
jgi:hypothetical protein